jgi:acetyltransferase
MLGYLMPPKALVVLGASRTPGNVGYEIMVNLVEGGYEREIIPVNPHADEKTSIIVAYLESITSGTEFIPAAQR